MIPPRKVIQYMITQEGNVCIDHTNHEKKVFKKMYHTMTFPYMCLSYVFILGSICSYCNNNN